VSGDAGSGGAGDPLDEHAARAVVPREIRQRRWRGPAAKSVGSTAAQIGKSNVCVSIRENRRATRVFRANEHGGPRFAWSEDAESTLDWSGH